MQVAFCRRSYRYGLSRLDVLAIVGILILAAVVILPQLSGPNTSCNRSGTCRNNLRGLAIALWNYSIRTGKYPGYLNQFETEDNKPFTDPTIVGTTASLPVSWAVMILPDIDRQPVFDQWRKQHVKFEAPATATAYHDKSQKFFVNQYIEQFLCPSDPQASKTGTPINYVVNTGMPDLLVVSPAIVELDDSEISGTPRDWAANGMFFDNFTTGPRVIMTDSRVADPKDKTILLTENVDATSYAFRAATHGADNWRAAEVQTGCIWRLGKVDESKDPPTMVPPIASLQPNVSIGQGDGTSYDYCRPSSRHPGYVNVAFVGCNVEFLRDNISYYVYAKLMASDDENVRIPGMSRDETDAVLGWEFRTRELYDVDINP